MCWGHGSVCICMRWRAGDRPLNLWKVQVNPCCEQKAQMRSQERTPEGRMPWTSAFIHSSLYPGLPVYKHLMLVMCITVLTGGVQVGSQELGSPRRISLQFTPPVLLFAPSAPSICSPVSQMKTEGAEVRGALRLSTHRAVGAHSQVGPSAHCLLRRTGPV